jgi:hypothetical protein
MKKRKGIRRKHSHKNNILKGVAKFFIILGCIVVALSIAYAIKHPEIIYKPTEEFIVISEPWQTPIQLQNDNYIGAELAQSWLSCDYCRLILLYPFTTEAGIGIAETDDGIYATYLIRRQAVKTGDRLYIKGKGVDQPNLTRENDEPLIYKSNPNLEQIEHDILRILNNERNIMVERGLDYSIVSWNQDLHELARIHSQNMAMKNKLFISPASMDSPYYQTIWYLPF